ncbi:Nucleoid-associated protein YejK [Propionispira arboris]|uniref:Nucleoid-associated protein YejK n=1 Tax=Propionispira arboris TaxID=84035 RepID=A0A1H6VZ70_9FIRM|nr:nucleoid-associated protein [Propionispira arboris]SEJ09968.1 Nucleoid-associated protein YejK [Propionispira arboris]
MIIIHRAILHILDFNSGLTVFSDQELLVENSVETFLLKHIEKSYADQNAKKGTFYEDSTFKEQLHLYLKEENTFIDFSKYIVKTVYTAISHSEQLDSADILVCDITIDDERKIVVFKCNNHMGFIHQVIQTDEGVKNDIINHYAIMPNLSQKIDEFSFINTADDAIIFVDKKYVMDGNKVSIFPEVLLECSQSVSPKETISLVSKIAKKVADEYGQDDIVAATAVKSFITETIQDSPNVEPKEIGREIFKSNPSMQASYMEQIQEAGLPERVEVEQEATLKRLRNHKLKTDTGIELTIPLDYFNNTDFVEFNNNPDGTLSITLKRILNVTNKS